MTDKSWLLNASAIAAAKDCIGAIEHELGVKLKLSHPQFLEMIEQYSELTDSEDLKTAYHNLKQFAQGAEVSSESKIRAVTKLRSIPIETNNSPVQATSVASEKIETISFKGKIYPRFDDSGQEFKGLYRGQARYA